MFRALLSRNLIIHHLNTKGTLIIIELPSPLLQYQGITVHRNMYIQIQGQENRTEKCKQNHVHLVLMQRNLSTTKNDE